MKDAGYREIGRFPSLILRHVHGPALLIVGYRPYAALCEALAWLAPDLARAGGEDDPVAYAGHWPTITAAEVAAGRNIPPEAALARLEEGVAEGRVRRSARGDTPVFGAPA